MVVVTPTYRLKSVRNSCVIEDFGDVFYLSFCLFWFSVGAGNIVFGWARFLFFLFCQGHEDCQKGEGFKDWVSFLLGSWGINRSSTETHRVIFDVVIRNSFVPHFDLRFPMNPRNNIFNPVTCLKLRCINKYI